MCAFFTALTSWQTASMAKRCHREHAGIRARNSLSAWLHTCVNLHWRGCLRLPFCLADSTFVVDNIRCQHSPPANHLRLASSTSFAGSL